MISSCNDVPILYTLASIDSEGHGNYRLYRAVESSSYVVARACRLENSVSDGLQPNPRPWPRRAWALVGLGIIGVLVGLGIIVHAWAEWSGCRATPGCFIQDTRAIAVRYLWGLAWVVVDAIVLGIGLSEHRKLRGRHLDDSSFS